MSRKPPSDDHPSIAQLKLRVANSNVPDAPEQLWQTVNTIASTKGLILDAALLRPVIINYFTEHPQEAIEIISIPSDASMVEQTERMLLLACSVNHALADYFAANEGKVKDAAEAEHACVEHLAALTQQTVNRWNSCIPFTRDWCTAQGDINLTSLTHARTQGLMDRVEAIREAAQHLPDAALRMEVLNRDPSPAQDHKLYGRIAESLADVTRQFSHDIRVKPPLISSDASMLLLTSNLMLEAAQGQIANRMTALNNEMQQSKR